METLPRRTLADHPAVAEFDREANAPVVPADLPWGSKRRCGGGAQTCLSMVCGSPRSTTELSPAGQDAQPAAATM